jgi:hypothetical protein
LEKAMNSYVVVFRGDANTGGYPIAITAAPEPVRLALESGLEELEAFARDVARDRSLQAKAEGGIRAVRAALAEVVPFTPAPGPRA